MTSPATPHGPAWHRLGETASVWPGRSWPLGATWSPESTNFAVWAPAATEVVVCLFDDEGGERQHRLTELVHGTWHGAVPGVAAGSRYGFRVDGPWKPEEGLRFNPAKLLLDPYARAVSGELVVDASIYAHEPGDLAVRNPRDSAPHVPKGVVVGHDVADGFDWEGDELLHHRWRDTVIYELHVKGMTALHDRVPEELRGTYAGLAHPAVVDYLVDLGISAVELLPVHQFVSEPGVTERGLCNYWGYNSLAYFAPHAAYSASGDRGGQVREFKEMVKAFHAAGIEVILDVVYNHTAEAGRDGPTLSLRGLDDTVHTRVSRRGEPFDDTYWDVTGCGNTVHASHPFALQMILDSLRYWVTEMHVDGFRFDLAPALTRTDHEVDMASDFMVTVGQDPVLRHVKLIAEPWDASMSGYQVGNFPQPWFEWNDQYRDVVRDYWRRMSGGIRDVATRMAGSSDLHAEDGSSPYASVNFVTAHDGFTLRDLVSYDRKHNLANGEEDRDGTDNNRSWNHGVEGETDDPEIQALRRRVAADVMVTLCLSAGVPMLTAGDERGRTQRGNNNAYCQDNETSWVDWRPDDAWLDLYEITKTALRLRREHPALRQRHHFEGRPAIDGGPKDLAWLHPSGREMSGADWDDPHLTAIGMFVSGAPLRSPGPRGEQLVDASFVIFTNAGTEPVTMELPENDWVQAGEIVLSTDPTLPAGTSARTGERLTLHPLSVVVLREA